MTLKELRKNPHISFSQISTYLLCSLKYRFLYVDKIPAEFTPLPLIFGSVIHSILAEYYQRCLESYPWPSLDAMQERFAVLWNNATSSEAIPIAFGNKAPEEIFEQGNKLLECFWEKSSPQEIFAIEEPFWFELDPSLPPLIGSIDLIECDAQGIFFLVDHKTAAKRYGKEKVQTDLQLTLYSLVAEQTKLVPKQPQLRFDVLIKTQKPQFQQYITQRSEKDHRRAIRIVRTIQKGIQAGIFVPNDGSYLCSSCQYQTHCRNWR